ncbi:MAG: (deoxy)nucleoside triphosphate pyrophosphohydrolase [Alphaproteobacteria bacterium]|nr:(deoxy)nucleoside triphosphate pyrophosphohydrolase [Alphaproteobacteria bacterium]
MPQSFPFLFVAAVALMDAQGRVLLAQRPAHKDMSELWEFPGGKLESGETPEEAARRELREELSVSIEESDLQPLTFVSHHYKEPRNFRLFMTLFLCTKTVTVENLEHAALAWVFPDQLASYPMPAADLFLAQFLARYSHSLLSSSGNRKAVEPEI